MTTDAFPMDITGTIVSGCESASSVRRYADMLSKKT